MAQAVITLAACASREVCVPDVWKGCTRPLVGSIIHLLQPSDWRLYFISPAFEKDEGRSAGSMSYMTTRDIVTAFLYMPFLRMCALT